MRGRAVQQTGMLFGVTTEEFIPERHPIRRIRVIIDDLLARLSPELTSMYAPNGRYSSPPSASSRPRSSWRSTHPLRAPFCERLHYDLLFKWFLGLNINDPPSTTPPSPRTASVSWSTASPPPSWAKPCAKRASADS